MGHNPVKPRLRKLMTQLQRGEDWFSLTSEDGLVDVANSRAMLVMKGPDPMLDKVQHFHCYLPLTFVRDKIFVGAISAEVEWDLFMRSLSDP